MIEPLRLARTLALGVALFAFLAAGLSGCAGIQSYRSPNVEFDAPPPMPVATLSHAAPIGTIFNAGGYRPLFEDYRARMAGDTITISIVERISASQKSTSSVERSGSLKGGITALPGLLPTAGSLARANVAGTSSNTHDGKGATEATNDFQGTITAIVVDVLPNGHLLISGEKQIGLNANVDVLRFSGQIDPRNIQRGNLVDSTAVANVRLQQRSRGQGADAQVMGLLGRFFLNVLPL